MFRDTKDKVKVARYSLDRPVRLAAPDSPRYRGIYAIACKTHHWRQNSVHGEIVDTVYVSMN